MFKQSEKQFQRFIMLLCNLSPVEMCGVAHMLGISFGTKENHREFHEVYEDILDRFLELNRRQRKNLIKIIAEAVKQNDPEPEHTEQES